MPQLFLVQSPNADVVDNTLDALEVVLDSVESLAKSVILQVQQPKPVVDVAQERGNPLRPLEVAQGDTVGGQSCELRKEVADSKEKVIDLDVKLLLVAQWNCSDIIRHEWASWRRPEENSSNVAAEINFPVSRKWIQDARNAACGMEFFHCPQNLKN